MTESIEPIVMKEETPDMPLEEDISLEAVNEVETEEATPSLPDSAQELETLRQEVEQLRAALAQKNTPIAAKLFLNVCYGGKYIRVIHNCCFVSNTNVLKFLGISHKAIA